MLRLFPLIGCIGALAATVSDAAVLCQRKSKIVVRPDACKSKETLVQDLGAVGTAVDATTAAITQLREDTLAACADTSRVRTPAAPEAILDAEDLCVGGCRTHDGDAAACNQAFSVGPNGAVSCYHFTGKCLPCGGCLEHTGVCRDACHPGPTCADATRTRFGGGTFGNACERFATQGDCEQAWHTGRDRTPATCYWDGSECEGCGARNELRGSCENTCTSGGPPTCPERSVFQSSCRNIGNQLDCEIAFHMDRITQTVASCYWDGSECRGCGSRRVGKACTNDCD